MYVCLYISESLSIDLVLFAHCLSVLIFDTLYYVTYSFIVVYSLFSLWGVANANKVANASQQNVMNGRSSYANRELQARNELNLCVYLFCFFKIILLCRYRQKSNSEKQARNWKTRNKIVLPKSVIFQERRWWERSWAACQQAQRLIFGL